MALTEQEELELLELEEEEAKSQQQPNQQQPIQEITTQRPSKIASFLRGLMAMSPFEQMKTTQFAQQNIPEPQPGQSLEQYVQSAQPVMQKREEEIAGKGAIAQLETPMTLGLALAGMQNPLAVAKTVGKFSILEGLTNLTGVNKAIQNIQQPELRDIADITKFALEGVLATRRWIPKKVSDNLANLINKPSQEFQLKQLGWKKQDVKAVAKETIDNLKTTDTAIKDTIRQEITTLGQELDRTIPRRAIDVQQKLPDFFRKNSDSYGEKLTQISDKLSNSVDYLSKENANAVLGKTLNELNEMGITEGVPVNMIRNLIKSKYGIDWEGFPADKVFMEANQQVSLKDFVLDVRGVRDNLSRIAKSGQRFAPEDVAVAVLQKNFGEFVSGKAPEFAQLQQEYMPIVQAMKEAGKLFRPYAGKFTNINAGNSLLRKYALGKSTPQETSLINLLEKGSNFSEGIGDFTSDIRSSGFSLLKNKEALKYQDSYASKAAQEIRNSVSPTIKGLNYKERDLVAEIENKKLVKKIKDIAITAGGTLIGVEILRNLIKGIARQVGD